MPRIRVEVCRALSLDARGQIGVPLINNDGIPQMRLGFYREPGVGGPRGAPR